MFNYSSYKIISAVPLSDILSYLNNELSALKLSDSSYKYNGLEIKITPYLDNKLPNLGISRHTIEAKGDKASAEQFLTDFRFRFLSAGG